MWTQPLAGTLLYLRERQVYESELIKIAAFDLDWTIVRPIKGKFPKTVCDWAFLPNRIQALEKFKSEGYIIAIFTNHHSTNPQKLEFNFARVSDIIQNMTVVDVAVMASKKDQYRKPNIGMWQILENVLTNFTIDKTSSFYCGDAAGRHQDFADTDRQFADNIPIPFYAPEEIFLNNKVLIPETPHMFIFVGMPGSGKSSFYYRELEPLGWVHANQDTFKTRKKVLSVIDRSLAEGKSVAVDLTNPQRAKRMDYINLANKYGVSSSIIYFVGNGMGFNKLREKPVPQIAYSVYFKNLEEPIDDLEGVEVIEIM